MSLKNDIERELGVPIRLRAGAPGSLRVLLDGQQIYSKPHHGDAPDSAEIVRMIRSRAAAN